MLEKFIYLWHNKCIEIGEQIEKNNTICILIDLIYN